MPLYALGDVAPEIHPDAYVHPDAVVIGNVTIGAESSVWPTAVLRGDDVDVSIAEIDKDAVRLVAGTWARKASERGPIAAGLRASCLERLRSAGLSSAQAE